MIITYRVNNELAGVLHLNSADPANAHIDPEYIEDNVHGVLFVHDLERTEWGFLQKKGYKKGDPIKIEVDDQTGLPQKVVWEQEDK